MSLFTQLNATVNNRPTNKKNCDKEKIKLSDDFRRGLCCLTLLMQISQGLFGIEVGGGGGNISVLNICRYKFTSWCQYNGVKRNGSYTFVCFSQTTINRFISCVVSLHSGIKVETFFSIWTVFYSLFCNISFCYVKINTIRQKNMYIHSIHFYRYSFQTNFYVMRVAIHISHIR